MRRTALLLAMAALSLCARVAGAQELVHFPSYEDNGPGQAATTLDGYLFRPADAGRHPAIVGVHGCSGMLSRTSGQLTSLYRQWAAEFTRRGYVVLLVDSLGPRQHGEMCSIGGFDLMLYRKRPRDAYGALLYLQGLPFVRADRIGLVGWSQGGAVTLLAIGRQSASRPPALPGGDFRVAVTFYPGGCNIERHAADWTTAIPLLVLVGGADVWTPAPPCKTFIDGAIVRGSRIEMQIYPGAYHAFDAPERKIQQLPNYVTRAGVIPIVGTDRAARADALQRVPAFLSRFLDN